MHGVRCFGGPVSHKDTGMDTKRRWEDWAQTSISCGGFDIRIFVRSILLRKSGATLVIMGLCCGVVRSETGGV